jgi:hypothetical protein
MIVVTVIMTMVVGMIVMRRRRMGIAMRVIMMLDGIATRIAGMRPEYRDQPRKDSAQQRQKDDCLNHQRIPLRMILPENRLPLFRIMRR